MTTPAAVRDANILVHTACAEAYQTEPHYRPENRAAVQAEILAQRDRIGATSLLDICCGQGFVIDLAKGHFRTIRGVDITPAMLAKVDTNDAVSDIQVQLAPVEQLPFPDRGFDLVTAYAALHHLYDLKAALSEAYRVLRPGGIFWSALDPNHYSWKALAAIAEVPGQKPHIAREVNAILHRDQEIADEAKCRLENVQDAEFQKHVLGGLREEDILALLKQIGFSSAEFRYHWFVGEGMAIHDPSWQAGAPAIRRYLQESLPLTRGLFKYVGITAVR